MKKLASTLLIAVALGFTAINTTAQELQLQGTIGQYPIAMQLSCDEESGCYDSRYFYLSSGQDIYMRGTKKGKHYTVTAGEEETFELDMKDNGSVAGTWRNSQGKTLTVQLQAINVAGISSAYDQLPFVAALKAKRPAEYLRTSLLSFARDSVVTYKNHQFVWLHEVKSGVSMFRLGNGFSAEVRERINPVLDKLHISNALDRLQCTSPYSGASIDYSVVLTYLDQNLLGFEISSYYDCGGAHPDFGSQGFLLDLQSGKSYEIDELLAFDKSVTPRSDDNFDAFSNYRQQFFAPKVMALEKEEHQFKKPSSEDDCDYLNPEVWNFPSWDFTEKGIEFTPSFPHVMAPCRESFLIPFSKLAIYKNPAFPYPFPR